MLLEWRVGLLKDYEEINRLRYEYGYRLYHHDWKDGVDLFTDPPTVRLRLVDAV